MTQLGRAGRAASLPMRAFVACTVLSLVIAACGSSRNSSSNNKSNGSGSNNGQLVDTSQCPAGQDTVGVSGNTITIGVSLPESGIYAGFSAILDGAKAYIDYLNSQGGVEVPKGSGKKYQIKILDKDDAYDAAKTVANVNSLINDSKVFALFDVVGTKNNLGVRDTISTQCVPNLLIASGAVQWGNRKFPWMLGSELVPYPLEMRTFVDYLQQKKPNATIAVLKANDDFGQSYADTLQKITQGTQLKIVQVQGYDPETSEVKSQVTSLAATHADAFVIGGTLLACPNALNAMGDAGWKPIVYVSGTCVSKTLLTLAGKNADKSLSVTPLLDPSDPANASKPEMQLYAQQIKKYASAAGHKVDPTDGIVAFGWSNAALLARIFELSPKLDRGTVMETSRTLKDVSGVGLQIENSKWNTNANDWFIGETFQLIQYDYAGGHSDPVGPESNLDGKTVELSPPDLLNQ